MEKVIVFRRMNRILSRPTLGESDGISIRLPKQREEYIIKAQPYTYTRPTLMGFGSKSFNAYICDARASVSVEIPTKKGSTEYKLRGETVKFEDLPTPIGKMEDAEGNVLEYNITPSHVFERSESSDLKRFNLAAGIPWLMIFLGMGTGGAVCLLIALGLMAWGKLHIG